MIRKMPCWLLCGLVLFLLISQPLWAKTSAPGWRLGYPKVVEGYILFEWQSAGPGVIYHFYTEGNRQASAPARRFALPLPASPKEFLCWVVAAAPSGEEGYPEVALVRGDRGVHPVQWEVYPVAADEYVMQGSTLTLKPGISAAVLKKAALERENKIRQNELAAQNYPASPIEVSDSRFDKEVLSSAIPVLVDFWSPSCMPCHMIAPILEEVAKEMQGKIVVAKLQIEKNPQVAAKYEIQALPTIILIKQGREVKRIMGASFDKGSLIETLKKFL
jgi:thioredoxin